MAVATSSRREDYIYERVRLKNNARSMRAWNRAFR